MNSALSLNAPLQSIFWQKTNTQSKEILFVITGALLLAICAHISIPLQPIPLTFQSAAVVLIGMVSGARLGTYTVGAYLIAGLCGLPVFAGTTTGSHIFFAPTAGYAIGFLPAVALSGYLAQKGWAKNVLGSFISSCLGASVIFLFGVSILAKSIGWHNAIAFGLLPFMMTEPVKLFVASLVIPKCWKKN